MKKILQLLTIFPFLTLTSFGLQAAGINYIFPAYRLYNGIGINPLLSGVPGSTPEDNAISSSLIASSLTVEKIGLIKSPLLAIKSAKKAVLLLTSKNGNNHGNTLYKATAMPKGYTTISIFAGPTAPIGTPGSVNCSGPVTLSASGSTPTGGVYNWYAAASGGTSLGSGTTFTTPSLAVTTSYYVDYTQGGLTSTRTAVIATVNTSPVIAPIPSGTASSPVGNVYLSYPFSGSANDFSGNNNTGTLQNAPTLTSDRYGNANSAYSFNGSNQYVSTATSTASPGPQNFSISVWFKTSSAGGKLVGYGSAQTGSSGNYDRHIYMSNTGQIYFGVYPGAIKTISSSATYADGNWHHVVATESTTNGANLYIDGQLQATDATMNTSSSFAGYWRVGYDNINGWTSAPSSYFFNGSLDDVAIYNTELTATQVTALYGGSSAATVCGSPLTLQVNTVSGATYSWSGPGGFTSALQNPTIASATFANNGTYTVTVTGATGCTSQLSINGTVNSGGPVIAPAPTGPTASLYLSYPFSGNTNDVSGNSNTGILENTPGLTTDR